MKRIRIVGLLLVAVFAMSAIVASVASAAEFEASKLGTAEGVQTSEQVFKGESGGIGVTCTKLSATEKITALTAKTQKAEVTYTGCTAASFPATVKPASKYLFNAGPNVAEPWEGSVGVENTVAKPIVIEVPIAGCTISISETGNSKLEKTKYVNVEPGTGHGKIEVQNNVSGITNEVKGGAGLCGKEGVSKTGSYTGDALVTLPEGEVKVIK